MAPPPPSPLLGQTLALDYHLYLGSEEFDAIDIPEGGEFELCLGGVGTESVKINFFLSGVC